MTQRVIRASSVVNGEPVDGNPGGELRPNWDYSGRLQKVHMDVAEPVPGLDLRLPG
jgi:hypothetical protein